jgi:hypothetical protein
MPATLMPSHAMSIAITRRGPALQTRLAGSQYLAPRLTGRRPPVKQIQAGNRPRSAPADRPPGGAWPHRQETIMPRAPSVPGLGGVRRRTRGCSPDAMGVVPDGGGTTSVAISTRRSPGSPDQGCRHGGRARREISPSAAQTSHVADDPGTAMGSPWRPTDRPRTLTSARDTTPTRGTVHDQRPSGGQ